jgi:uncharacterized damage-inducible protein DinB
MPYHVIKYKHGWIVANQNTGKHYSKHAMTKENAEAQMRAMYHAMRPADIRPQHHLASPPSLFAPSQHQRPRDILAHLNPHL